MMVNINTVKLTNFKKVRFMFWDIRTPKPTIWISAVVFEGPSMYPPPFGDILTSLVWNMHQTDLLGDEDYYPYEHKLPRLCCQFNSALPKQGKICFGFPVLQCCEVNTRELWGDLGCETFLKQSLQVVLPDLQKKTLSWNLIYGMR